MNLRESLDEAAACKQMEYDQECEKARKAMQEERLKQDRAALLRHIGFDRAMKDVK